MVLDLPHGILSLDDFPFSPQTTNEQLRSISHFASASSCSSCFRLIQDSISRSTN